MNVVSKAVMVVAASIVAVTGLATTASAQTGGVVIMRKVIQPRVDNSLLPPSIATPTPTPTGTPTSVPVGYYSWVVTAWVQSGTCGSDGAETRTVSCKRTDGAIVADALCTGNGSGPKPIASEPVVITSSCSYAWRPGDWSAPSSTCGTAIETRDVSCVRSDGSVADANKCGTSAPSTSQAVTVVSGCTFRWSAGTWGEPSTQCGDATQTRTVSCLRSDGTSADDASCAGADAKPDATQTVHETVGCSNVWVPGEWGTPQAGCGNVLAYRTVSCQRSDGVTVVDSQCMDAKPALTEPAVSYATCTDGRTAEHPYGWSIGDYGPLSTTCGDATRTRVVTCTDNDGKAVDDSQCVTTKPSATVSSHEISGCGFSWQTGDFGTPQPACGASAQNRAVTCLRADGTTVSDSSCSAQTRPSSTQPATDYSSCTFGWAPGAWSDVSTTCGDARQTRTVVCQRSDGTTADDASCGSQPKPDVTQSSHQVSGCGFSWNSGSWTPAPACGATTSTRAVTCLRSDGQAVDDAQCSQIGAKPPTTQDSTDYSTCSFTWAVGTYSAPSTTCGSATQTRSVTCQRSDSQSVDDSSCAGAGAKPTTTQTTTQTASCTYAWTPAAYGAATPACGASTHSRTVSCQRSDGVAVDGSLCTGAEPATSEATTDYSTCGYSWNVSAWNGSGTCGSSAVQNRTVTCSRTDGTTVPDSTCLVQGAGAKPATSQTVTDYSGCSYAWNQVVGTWSSTCSAAATRTNTVTCVRSDKVSVDASFCDASTMPSASDTQAVTTSCTYAGTYGSPTTCTSNTPGSTAGTQTVTVTSCARSDGTTVANSLCTPATKSQSCVPANTSDQYARLPGLLIDTSYQTSQSNAYRLNSNPVSGGVYNFSANNTVCWDSVNSASVAASYCSALSYGTNIYDLVSVPATYVAGLHEIYVSQADITAANVHYGTYRNAANNTIAIATLCAGTGYSVLDGAVNETWMMYCGTPDSASNYTRLAASLQDPATLTGTSTAAKTMNVSTGSTFSFAVKATSCWNVSTKATASSTKCQYISTGPNVYDLASIAATYVPDLRALYVNQADLLAALPNSTATTSSIYYNTSSSEQLATACNGLIVSIQVAGVAQSWTLYCGTPDSSSHYARQVQSIQDPSSLSGEPAASKTVNVNTGSTLSFAVKATQCWDTTANAQAAAAKCQYLASGANVYDLASVSATYVTDLREVYVAQADVQAIMPNSASLYNSGGSGVSLATACGTSGMAITVYVAGVSQGWTMRCGSPDSSAHYARQASVLYDLNYSNYPTAAQRASNVPTGSTYGWYVYTTLCWDTTAKTTAAAAKCAYLPTGVSVGDVIRIPATFNSDLHEVYYSVADFTAMNPNAVNDVLSYAGNYYTPTKCAAAAGMEDSVTVSGTNQSWTGHCGPPDTSTYVRDPVSLYDPYTYGSGTTKTINSATSSTLSMYVYQVGCWNMTTGAAASVAAKCTYVTGGPAAATLLTVPATWNTTAKTVVVNKSDILASAPYVPATALTTGTAICSSTAAWIAGGTSYKVTCQ